MRKRRTQKDPCCCLICGEEVSGRGLHTHIDRTHLKLTKYSSGHNGRYSDDEYKDSIRKGVNKYNDATRGKIKKFEVTCEECQHKVIVEEREKSFPSKSQYFCSKSCSAKYSSSYRWTDEARRHVQQDSEFGFKSEKRRLKSLETRKIKPRKMLKYNCKHCGIVVESYSKRVFCSFKCRSEHLKLTTDRRRSYRTAAQFEFSLKDYPAEFDFTLIEQHGWYSPANKRNNLLGVSRDHMVSVNYGFKNNIDPTIIKHPANCQLLVHGTNKQKGTNCSISLEQLLERIKMWNEKYNLG